MTATTRIDVIMLTDMEEKHFDLNGQQSCKDRAQCLRSYLKSMRGVVPQRAESPKRQERTARRLAAIAPLVITSLLTGLDARADLLTIAWDDHGRFERSTEGQPRQFAEVCGALKRGQAIAWSFEADRPVLFNVHYHDGPRVIFPEKREARKDGRRTATVEADQDFCWM